MKKYIDADKAIKDYARYGIKHFYDATDLEAILNECHAADVVEVVRCKECIHWNAETNGCKRNPSVYRWYAKDFCSNGVR